MNSFKAGMRNEIYKLRNKKKYLVFLIIGIVVCVGRVGIGMLIEKISSGSVSIHGNIMLSMLPFAVQILIPLVIFLAATDLFCSEFQEDTMKGTLMMPITRIKLLFAKSAAILIVSVIYLYVIYFVCLILQLLSGGKFTNIVTSFAAYTLDIFPFICLIGLAVFINLIVKSPGLAMLLLIAIYAIMTYFNYFSTAFGQTLFTAYLQWHKLLIGTMIPRASLLTKIGILTGTDLVLFSVSCILFDKRNV